MPPTYTAADTSDVGATAIWCNPVKRKIKTRKVKFHGQRTTDAITAGVAIQGDDCQWHSVGMKTSTFFCDIAVNKDQIYSYIVENTAQSLTNATTKYVLQNDTSVNAIHYKKWVTDCTISAAANGTKYATVEWVVPTDYNADYDLDTQAVTFANSQWINIPPLQPPKPQEQLKRIFRLRHGPTIIKRVEQRIDEREIRAQETLRRLVGEDAYRKFLKSGFVSVQNRQSKRIYQIFPGHDRTIVFEGGKKIASLCVLLSGNFPPTDHMIVRYLLAVNNEAKLWERANKGVPYTGQKIIEGSIFDSQGRVDHTAPLTEIYRRLKASKVQGFNPMNVDPMALAEEEAFDDQNYDAIAVAA